MTEAELQAEILLTLGRMKHVRVWRQNSGLVRSMDTDRVMRAGVVGGGDISGIVSVPIGGDRRLGVRLEIEVKGPKGRQRPEQKNFQRMIDEMGGIYILAKSVEDAVSVIRAVTGEPDANDAI